MRIRTAAATATATLVLAGITTPALAARTTEVTSPASDPMSFVGMPTKLKPGTYTFRYTNKSGMTHDLKVGAVETPDFDKGTRSITVKLKKGTVKYLCTLPGHAAAGMKGRIRVG